MYALRLSPRAALHTIFTHPASIFTRRPGRRHYDHSAVPGLFSLIALALLALAVALVLGFVIATWWLRPPRLTGPRSSVRTSKG
jgi:hypothetical protein